MIAGAVYLSHFMLDAAKVLKIEHGKVIYNYYHEKEFQWQAASWTDTFNLIYPNPVPKDSEHKYIDNEK